jgi:hypothetical protein
MRRRHAPRSLRVVLLVVVSIDLEQGLAERCTHDERF